MRMPNQLPGSLERMNSKRTALLAVTVTGIAATLLSAFTATPEAVTQLIIGVEAIAASAIVVFIVLRVPSMQALPIRRQRQMIWFSASGAGMVVCVLPLILRR